MKVLVARYQESVDWTNGLENVIIYNKGPGVPNSKHPSITLPNIGREGHTYLYHIIENYDNLDDYTCFLQGFPFDHSPDIEKRLKLFMENPVPFAFMSGRLYNSYLCYDCSNPGDSEHATLIRAYYDIFGVHKTNQPFQFGAGAQFIVSRDSIRSRSKEFYKNILRIMSTDINPAEGCALERFWHMIFMHTD
jgi:hypothetical protein